MVAFALLLLSGLLLMWPTQSDAQTTVRETIASIRGYVEGVCGGELKDLINTSEYDEELWIAENEWANRPWPGPTVANEGMLHSGAVALALHHPVGIVSTIEALPNWPTGNHAVEGLAKLRSEIGTEIRAGVRLADCLVISSDDKVGYGVNDLIKCVVETSKRFFDLVDADYSPEKQRAQMHELRVAAYTDCDGKL